MPDDQTGPGRDVERRGNQQRRYDDTRGRPHEEDPNMYDSEPTEQESGSPSGETRVPDDRWRRGA
jgi:hypothetical protein